jgi:hypothetical protein
VQYTFDTDTDGLATVRSLDEWHFVAGWIGNKGEIAFSPDPPDIVELRKRYAEDKSITSDMQPPFRLVNYELAREEFEKLAKGLQRANGRGPYCRPKNNP